MTTADMSSEQRAIPDRRRHPTPMLSRFWLRGRRRGGRRAGEQGRIYVDRYEPTELLLVGLVLGLCGADLVATVLHLQAGGGEVNPLMDGFLRAGGLLGFGLAKLALTGPALLFLLLHVRFALARRALWGLAVAYGCLLAWHAVVWIDRAALG